MKHFNRLAEFIGNNYFIGSFEDLYRGNCCSKLIGIESGKSEFVTFPKHENSTTEGKEGENEKSEGKGKGKFETCRDPGFKIRIESGTSAFLSNPSPRQFLDNGTNKAIKKTTENANGSWRKPTKGKKKRQIRDSKTCRQTTTTTTTTTTENWPWDWQDAKI